MLNVEMTKVRVFKKGRQKKEMGMGLRRKKIYLRFFFYKNHNIERLVDLKQLWGTGKTIFSRKVSLFGEEHNYLSGSVWGWEENRKLETVQEKFLKLTLRVDSAGNMKGRAGRRVPKFEERIRHGISLYGNT